MHVIGRAALAAGGLAAGGVLMHQVARLGSHREADEKARIDGQVDTARAQWSEWKGALDREFPGLELPTPADHARLKQFLAQNPAPSWIDVEHDGFTRIHLDADESFLAEGDQMPPVDQGFAYMIGFGGMFAVGGAVAAARGVAKGAPKLPSMLGMTVGGALAVAFGVTSVIGGVDGFRTPAPQAPAWKLREEVDAFN